MLSAIGMASQSLNAQEPREWLGESIVVFGSGQPEPGGVRFGQVSSGVILTSQTIAVAHGARIDILDVSEGLRSSIGGIGDAPGLFRSVDWIGTNSDAQIVAYDRVLRRVTYFDSTGAYIRSFAIEGAEFGVAPWVVGILNDGAILTAWRAPPIADAAGGLAQRRVRLVTYDSHGTPIRMIREVSGGEAYRLAVPGRGFALRQAPFSPVPRYAASGDAIFATTGQTYAAEVFDTSGRVLATIGDTTAHVPVTDSLKDAFLRDTLSTWPEAARPRIEAAFRIMLVHDTFALVADMVADAEGNVWLRRRQISAATQSWDIFGNTGRQVAVATFPPHSSILDTKSGIALLLQRDFYGRDCVAVYSTYGRRSTR
jgi:hypothetical protein